jgi:hypothetical protein
MRALEVQPVSLQPKRHLNPPAMADVVSVCRIWFSKLPVGLASVIYLEIMLADKLLDSSTVGYSDESYGFFML